MPKKSQVNEYYRGDLNFGDDAISIGCENDGQRIEHSEEFV
jgi:hypothetical protein